jgi:1-deoxy-D-xylulose-5-phosphate synthase
MEYKILNNIKSPADLKQLSYAQLDELAVEVRDFMVETVSSTGGHLASSLGAVEATIALYRVFSPPEDRIIWDVGHQAYTHKILTGRKARFKTLRQYGGISGFLKPDESKYDFFGAGHTSTSISAAMGFAKARDLKGENYSVVAVLGDASLANGMSLEAINHIGHDKTDMLVVVIDNEMSISPTVGALSNYLNGIITGRMYNNLRQSAKKFLETIPKNIGSPVAVVMKHIEEGIKGVFSPGALFEELGFKYFGPITNGHNIKTLTETLIKLKEIRGPKLLHVITKKGHGYAPAEKNPTLFHGIGPFNRITGELIKTSKQPTYSKIFSEKLISIAGKDRKILAIVAAMKDGTNLSRFKELYPDRFFDVGIAEEHAVTFAAGLAKNGFKPVVAIYSTFLQRAVDQIIHDVAIHRLHVIFTLDRAGLVGEDGATHHGVFDIVFMKMIPGMIVMAPSGAQELERMLLTASNCGGPVAIRFPRGIAAGDGGKNAAPVRIGRAKTMKNGRDMTIVCLGPLLNDALAAVKNAENKTGGSIEVIDARFAKPIDKKMIFRSVKKTRRLITVEEGVVEGGFGQSVTAAMQGLGLTDFVVKNMGIPDKFIEHGTMEQLRADCGLSARGIERAIYELIDGAKKKV